MTLPVDAEATLQFTDRAGGEYGGSPFDGEISPDLTKVTWLIDDQGDLDAIPAGANFEVFITIDAVPYKVRYGRVVRKEVAYPLSPLAVEAPPPLMYEDDLQRNQVGPRWIAKHGRVSMHQPAGAPQYAMAARNSVEVLGHGLSNFERAAVLWYAPLQSDTVELTIGMCDGGPGTTTILLCSDYQMRSFVGVRFYDSGGGSGDDGLRIVTGTGWTEIATQGDHYDHVVPSNGNYYTIRYSLTTNKVSVWVGDSTGSPALEWADTSHLVQHGAGFRYVGGIWNASFVTSGPQMYYFKAKDAV